MENNRTFEITDLAGENLENVRWHGFMTVYAIVSTNSGHRVTTEVDYERETNPKWDTPINFTLHDPFIHNNILDLIIRFFCDRTFNNDKYIAGFRIPVKRLFDEISGNVKSPRAVRYPVVDSAGREKGFVKFSFKFGELPKPTQKQHPSPPQPKPPSQSPEQPPSSQQPQPSQRPKRQPQSTEQPPPQQELPSQSPQTPSSQQPRPPQRPKRKPQSPEQPPPQEPRPSSQSTQQPRPRPQQPRSQLQQQGPPPQPMPPSGQQQLRPQQPRPQQQQYPPQSRPPPRPQQQQCPPQSRPPPRPQQRPYPQQTRPPPPRPRPRPPPQSTQNVAAVRAQFVATGQVQVPLSENSPNPHENPTEPALDNHIDQLNISVEAQYGIDPDHDNNIPSDNQFEYPENETYGQMSAPEFENNEINHNRDECQDNEEGYGNNDEGNGYDGADNGEDYGDGEEGIEEGYQDDGVNNGEDYGDGEENYDDEEDYGGEEEEDYEDDEG